MRALRAGTLVGRLPSSVGSDWPSTRACSHCAPPRSSQAPACQAPLASRPRWCCVPSSVCVQSGAAALASFVENGGTLLAFNEASNYAIEALKLPVKNVLAGVRNTDFYAPGSILAVEIKRVAGIEAVEQLTRYLERIRLDPALGECRGVLAAQVIKPQARVLAGLDFAWQILLGCPRRGSAVASLEWWSENGAGGSLRGDLRLWTCLRLRCDRREGSAATM